MRIVVLPLFRSFSVRDRRGGRRVREREHFHSRSEAARARAARLHRASTQISNGLSKA